MRIALGLLAAGILGMIMSCASVPRESLRTIRSAWTSKELYVNRMVRSDPRADYVKTTLEQIVKTPQEYTGDVEFECVFNQVNEEFFLHIYTPFTPDRYTSLSVWPSESSMMTLRDFGNRLVPTLYVRKDNPTHHDIQPLKKYQSIRVWGAVRSHFDNRPWIEVYLIDEGSVTWNERALNLMLCGDQAAREGKTRHATAHYNEAMSMGVPAQAQKSALVSAARSLAAIGTEDSVREAKNFYARALEGGQDDRLAAEVAMLEPGKPVAPGTQEEMDRLRADLARREAEIAELKEKLSKAGDPAEIEALKKARDEQEQAAAALKAEKEKVEGEFKAHLEQCAAKMADTDRQLQELKGQMDGLAKERDEAKKAAEESLAKVAELQKKIEDMGKPEATQIAQLQKELEDAKAAKAASDAKVTELEKKVEELGKNPTAEQLAAVQKELDDAKTAKTAAEAKVADLEKKVEELSKGPGAEQVAALQKQLDDAKAAQTAAEAKVADLEKKVEELGKNPTAEQLAAVQKELDDAKTARTAAEARTAELVKQAADLQTKIDELSKGPGAEQIAALQKQLDDAKAARTAAETQVTDLNGKVADLEQKLKDAQAQTGGSAEQIRKLEEDLAKAREEAARGKEAIREEVAREYEETIGKLRRTIKSQRDEIEELLKRLEERK
jgi:chromosome segregation ATPase